jgi:uncharacterized protein (TIGR03435 family)
MKSDRDRFEKTLHRHLGLFGSPSASQIEASRGRIRERLRVEQETTATEAPLEVRAQRASYFWRAGLVFAATAAGIVLVVTAPWKHADWIATVEAADGSHYTIGPNAVLRPDGSGATMLTLKDGSRVEMRSHSELSLERASDGIGIRLRTGGVIVNAAKQDRGHLYVHTKDMTVAVVGTMFVVNAEESGSRVTVIEGEVQVREGTSEKKLKPGERIATSPALATRPVKEEFSWSRRADAIYAAFAKGMAETAAPLKQDVEPAIAAAAAQSAAIVGQTQAAAKPEFEEASIRECDPDNLPEAPEGGRGGGANSFRMTPGRVSALCMTLATLIRTAYGYGPIDLDFISADGSPNGRGLAFDNVYGLGVEDGRRVRGGPDWIRSERYTVNAIAGVGVQPKAEALRGPMLQHLLERRFQLKAHIQTEEVPAFALTVAKGGLKMKPVTTDDCEALPARPGSPMINGQPINVLGRPRSFADVRNGQKPSCALWSERNGPNIVLVGGNIPIEGMFIRTLASRLGGVRVLDKTGVTDRFNFVFEFAVDENAPGPRLRGLPPETTEPSDIPLAATIFRALEEQLGLKLEPAKAGREFIVIDHVERLSPN